MEPTVGDRDPQADRPLTRPTWDERDLVDRESEVVQPADPRPHGMPVVGREQWFIGQLGPDSLIRATDGLGRGHGVVEGVRTTLHGAEVGQAERHVLDEDVQVVAALPVGQRRVDLAGLGIHQEGLDPVAVAPEQRVGQ